MKLSKPFLFLLESVSALGAALAWVSQLVSANDAEWAFWSVRAWQLRVAFQFQPVSGLPFATASDAESTMELVLAQAFAVGAGVHVDPD